MKTLIIAEKPSVGRDIAGALDGVFQKRMLADLSPKAKKGGKDDPTFLESDDYVITWAVGHLVQLAEPEEYDEKWKKWRMKDLPIVPPDGFKLVPRDAKSKKQLKLVATLLNRDDVEHVVNACDAGREGELIFAYLYESVFGVAPNHPDAPKPVERLWISSMTKQAIREGFEKLRPGEQLQPLESAARARSEADWLVGMNATRAATIRGRAWVGGVVSLGRVQTPTLAIIVRREREIQAFVPEPYWLVHASFDPRYEGLWFDPLKADDKDTPTGQETWLKEAERADEIVTKVSGKTGIVDSVERKEQSQSAPLLYDLTSLQRDANSRFGFSARRTLQAAQSLYEGKKAITYPRTNSRYLSGDLVPQLKPTAATLADIPEYETAAHFVMKLDKLPLGRVVNDAKVEDHHAIIPTDVPHDVSTFSPDERRIFDLVARRFLAIFHPPARYARTEIVTLVEEERFRTRGKVTLEAGWRGVYGVEADVNGKTQEEDPESAELPPLEKGQEVKVVAAESEPKETRPPARYTRGDAPLGDGDRRQADRRRGAARGDEGARPGDSRDPRRDDRDAHPPRVHRARRQGSPSDPEGAPGDHDARGEPAHLARADRQLGKAAWRHRARQGREGRLHPGNRGLHESDRGGDRRPRQGEAATRAGRARPLSAVRRRDGRDHSRELEGLRLHELEVTGGDGLRFRDLEAGRGPDADS